MAIFNKVAKQISRGGSQLFNKGTIGGSKLFGKSSIASKALGTVNRAASRAGQMLGSASSNLASIVSNPAVAGLLAASGPVGAEFALGANALSGALGAGSSIAKAGGALTHQRDYHGKSGDVAGQIAANLDQFKS